MPAPPVEGSSPSARTAAAVPTTTPIAFWWEGAVYLERMNVLGADGCGVLTDAAVPAGTVLPVAFRLSTRSEATRCRAEVMGATPVTPGALARAKGKGAPPPVPVAGVGDSATAIFRMADLADGARRSPVPQPPSAPGASEAPAGLCLRFVDLDEVGRRAVAHHLQTSRQLADRIAAQGGTSVAEARLAIADSFHEGDLSRRALDW